MENIIDTLKVRYDFNTNEQKSELLNYLADHYPNSFTVITKTDGYSQYRCSIRNLSVFVDTVYLFVEGSLSKFYIGDNVNPMSIQDLNSALGLINKSLGYIVDINNGYVRRLDFGVNLVMSNKPTAYISKLYSLSSRKPAYFNGQTISSGNKSRGIIIYDKTAEVEKSNRKKKTRTEVPDKLLRIEASMRGRKVFEKRFGTDLPTVEKVLKQIDKLPDALYEEYNRLDKDYTITTDQITNKDDFYNYTIVTTGMDKCKYIIDYSRDLNLISKQNRDRYYAAVKKAFKKPVNVNSKDLMKELDDKMLEWYNRSK